MENAVCGVSALSARNAFSRGYNTEITGDPVDTGLDAKKQFIFCKLFVNCCRVPAS